MVLFLVYSEINDCCYRHLTYQFHSVVYLRGFITTNAFFHKWIRNYLISKYGGVPGTGTDYRYGVVTGLPTFNLVVVTGLPIGTTQDPTDRYYCTHDSTDTVVYRIFETYKGFWLFWTGFWTQISRNLKMSVYPNSERYRLLNIKPHFWKFQVLWFFCVRLFSIF